MTELQFTILFKGAFGSPVEAFDMTVDSSGAEPVARKGDTIVSLLTVEGRGIEWQVNHASIGVPFSLNGRDSAGDHAKAIAHQKLVASLG